MSNLEQIMHPSIKKYLQNLSKQLDFMPQVENDQHVLEIKGHLEALISQKMEQGKEEDQAVNETLQNFLPPNDLAKQIAGEVKQNKQDQFGGDNGFKVGLGFLFGGFGSLAVSILKGTFELAAATIGLLGIGITLAMLLYSNVAWNGEKVETLRSMGKTMIYFVIPLGAFSFIIRSFIDREPNFLSFFFMLTYMAIAFLVYYILKCLYYKKKQDL